MVEKLAEKKIDIEEFRTKLMTSRTILIDQFRMYNGHPSDLG